MKDKKEHAVEKMEQSTPAQELREYVPAVDIYEKDDAILIRFDMPGVRQEQVDIQLDNNELEITATQAAGAPEGMELLTGEYGTGMFRRKFSVPQQIDREKIQARLHNGVLNLELPKAEQAKPRKIEITAGG